MNKLRDQRYEQVKRPEIRTSMSLGASHKSYRKHKLTHHANLHLYESVYNKIEQSMQLLGQSGKGEVSKNREKKNR